MNFIFLYDKNLLLQIPLSNSFAKMLFNIIKIIGPINIPITPIILNPVYIDINVKIGWIPILLLTIFGSKICLTIDIIIHKEIIDIPNFKSPFNADIIAHGTITVPEPKIGKASTNPIPSANNNGYFIFIPIILNKYKPITDIIKDTKITHKQKTLKISL